MKCPERYLVIQQNHRMPTLNDNNEINGEYSILIENQIFPECFKENCAAWDAEKQRCRKF